ncbi:MAG: hypothetical protein H6Q72_2204 [Firmicutes bacterium]|nr:hypothetical protein [Bacillota bacterium]
MKAIHLFSGHGQLPAGTDLYETSRYATIVLTVNIETGEVIDCVIPNYCEMHQSFVADIIRGKYLDSDSVSIISELEERVHSLSTRALITAFQQAHNRYMVYKGHSVSQYSGNGRSVLAREKKLRKVAD